MVFLIHGQESFLSYKNLSDTKKRFLEKHPDGYNLAVFDDYMSYDLDKIKDSLKNYSLFSAKVKLVVIKDFLQQKNNSEKEKLIDFLKESGHKSSKTEHIIFFETSDISKDPLYPKIKEIASEKMCRELSSIQLEKWIIDRLFQENISAPPRDAKKIIASFGKNLWQLSNELEKIISWLKNQNIDSISDMPDEFFLAEQHENNIFNTVEAIAKKDISLALNLLKNHLDSGESELYIFSMIAYQFKTLIKIKSALDDNIALNDLSKKLKLHPYALKKSLPMASLFTLSELKKFYKTIILIEEKIKKGASGAAELKQFIIDIAN